MNNQAAIGFLNVSQSVLADSAELHASYDLCITAIGWERRSNHALKNMVGRSSNTKLLKFSSTDDYFISKKKENEESALAVLGSGFQIVYLSRSVDFAANFIAINELILDAVRVASRPISILIDISCVPKRYFLFLLGLGFKREIVGRMDILYSEGKYAPADVIKNGTHVDKGFVSDGEWTSVQIPYLEDSDYSPDSRDLFVSVGAEVTLAMPTVERFEPTALRLYKVSDSDKRFPENYLSSEEPALAALAALPRSSSVAFALDDIIGMSRDILDNRTRHTTCLAIGPKPHALALGIAALADDRIQVVCRTPKAYVPSDVSAAGPILRFTIEDRFDPLSCWPT
ncbi:hypothetical protein [Mesorhizobium sp. L2C066B000]|uniref:hypothetical protein n=1 Tax=Mesorhizobium sp. L2C066B000 TaxID=1287105 RepID=UPI0004CF5B1E|nr:hypothetical protein [Mesorhizobium sp. L2C066B000]